MLAVFSHDTCEQHDMGESHPESPLRLKAVQKATKDITRSEKIEHITATPADTAIIKENHSQNYIDEVLASAPQGDNITQLDADTAMNQHSLQASLLAVGAATSAVDWAFSSKGNRSFCAIRPPGHHAEPTHAMGFCIFNNIAVAAKYAQNKFDNCTRVAVIDFDVHHGNGTQTAFYNDKNLFFASSHQFPYYPGSGDISEKGQHDNIVNAPLPAGSGSEEFHTAYDTLILPKLKQFKPDLLMISAGFDAHKRDPLAAINLESQDYFTITEKLCDIADEFCEGRIVSVLEGGYDLQALYESSHLHMKALSHV